MFDLPHHQTGFILDIEFLNLRSTTIYLVDLELQLPWDDPRFCWLPDPGTQNHNAKKAHGRRSKRKRMQHPPRYCFPSSNGLDYSRDQVVNHYLAENGKLTQKPMRGLLLAIGAGMPFGLRHGSPLDASLVLREVGGIAHRQAVTFCIDRRAVMSRPKTQNLGLFEPSRANYGSGVADPAHQPQTHVSGTMVKLR